ncbi:hypothetical protein [Luoshenia tenuis]|jgi:hypothetical protein|uniref:hypothetical protein n=1 Tax=Luoshenia tenuis TaxID=2763654 RepID=UPI003D8EC323
MKKTYALILTLLISALGILPPAAAALAQGEMALAPAAQHLQEKNLLLAVAIVDGILLLSTVALALILGIRRRRHRLDRVLARSGRAYAPGEAGKALSPVMREVATLHAKGRAHGGICAAHMTLGKDGQIYLSGGRGRMPKKEAYALAPERREGGANTCPGDIYALGAVLQRMTVGENPLAQADPVIQSAMAQEPEKRPDIAALTAALGADDEEMSKGRGQRGKAARIAMGCVGGACVLALAASGVWASQAAPRIKAYDAALTALAQGERETCQQYLQDLPKDYADVAQLKGYLEADALQEEEFYKAAAEAYTALGDYRDAMQRSVDCRVELIWYLMDRDHYETAKQYADDLVKEAASGAEEIDKELDYRYALKQQERFLDKADFQDGLQAIRLLGYLKDENYSDAGEKLEQLRQRAYDKALDSVGHLRPGEDFEFTLALLSAIDGYKDSNDYLQATLLLRDTNLSRRQKCEKIMAEYWKLEPIRTWVQEVYLLEFLTGEWKGEEGRFFTLRMDDEAYKIDYMNLNLVSWRTYPLVYFKDNKFFGDHTGNEEKVDLLLSFTVDEQDPNRVTVQNEIIGKSYTLTRVK